MKKEEIIKINKKLSEEFKTETGILNEGNLEYAVTHNNPYLTSREILRGHPFIDGNKRTALMVYLLGTSGKTYREILKDYYDMFLALSK